MGVIFRKQKEVYSLGNIKKLTVVGFIAALSSSLVGTIWAVYMDSFLENMAFVGFLSATLTLVSFLAFFSFIPLMEKFDRAKIYLHALILFAITYILFAINTKFYGFIILAFIFTVLTTLRMTSFGIIVRDNSLQDHFSNNEGLIYTFMNMAWVIGPLISGEVSARFGINLVFVLAAIFLIFAIIIFKLSKIRSPNIKEKLDGNLIKNFIAFFKSKHRIYAYIMGGGVTLWWSLIYLFIPLYIIRTGLGATWVGYFLFTVAMPLMLFEFYFSTLAGRLGFKKMFKIGFLIPGIISIICFFLGNTYIILGLLVLASIGLAMVEPTSEAYFFHTVGEKEVSRFYGPYNTTIEINDFIGKMLSATILMFLPFKYVFLFFGFAMFLFVFLSFRIKNVYEGVDGRKV